MSSPSRSPWMEEIDELQKQDLFRIMPAVAGLPGRVVTVDGRPALNFSSNNYLGLAGHPALVKAMAETASMCGVGSTASRLISGTSEAHRELESFIAAWKETDAALVFGSGYQANVGILTALTDGCDLIVSDELNHASIVDGCRLSRAQVIVYPHLDLNRAEDALKSTGFRRKLLVTESVFSMDGDRAPLKELDELCRRWGAVLMVDEAHATGVAGPLGRGLASEDAVVPEIQMGTLGKAVGVCGAYVAGSRGLVQLLVNKARSLIYTTAAAPAIQGAVLAALKIITSDEGEARRRRLTENTVAFNRLLKSVGLAVSTSSHIVPIRIGDSARTMQVSRECLARRIFAHGIRYPTVPEGTARLRLTLMSDHTEEDLQQVASVLSEILVTDSMT
jgi:8-amino-7-oxononanoate synthase